MLHLFQESYLKKQLLCLDIWLHWAFGLFRKLKLQKEVTLSLIRHKWPVGL